MVDSTKDAREFAEDGGEGGGFARGEAALIVSVSRHDLEKLSVAGQVYSGLSVGLGALG